MTIHPSAHVDEGAHVGDRTRVWHGAHVRGSAMIGDDCIIGEHVYVGAGVRIGNRCKIQNNALVYEGATLQDGVFVGPGAIVANDRRPRAVTPDGTLKSGEDWTLAETVISAGASIGAGAIIVPPVTIGTWAVVAAGAIVTRDVPPHALVAGAPARQIGWVCACGERTAPNAYCKACGRVFEEVV